MLDKLKPFFDINEVLGAKDNFTNYQFSFIAKLNIEKLNALDKNQYNLINNYLKENGYDWTLHVESFNYSISQKHHEIANTEGFEEGDSIKVVFTIFKKGNHVVIFNEEKFYEFLENESLIDIISYFNTKDGVVFYNENLDLKRSNSFLGINKSLKDSQGSIKLSSQCNFTNFSSYKFSPDDFFIAENPSDNPLLILFDKLYLVFTLAYLYDSSEILENSIKTTLRGFKTFRHTSNFNSLDLSSLKTYHKIFEFAYSEKTKVEDKLGIVRNILSMYLESNSINISWDAYHSILSANNTYIKGNISKYIEVRNKVHDQLEQLSERVNKALDNFYNNFQKTIFVFISFYLSIVVIRTYSKTNITVVFDKQLTYMAIAILALSLIFMLFSLYILKLEKERISSKYEDVKKRAEDVLVHDDIKILLKEDEEFNSEKNFLDKRRNIYIILWVITLVIFATVLIFTSNHI